MHLPPEIGKRYFFRYSPIIFWGLPLIFLIQFTLATDYGFRKTNTLTITGLSDRQPGIGRINVFSDPIPDFAFTHYRIEQLLNSYNTGSYLLWKWYPDKKVFIDSRSITYKKDFYDDYMRNYAFDYIGKMDLQRAILSITYDRAWYEEYLAQNWTPIAFDTNMMLLKRRSSESYSSSYGVIPEFIGDPKQLETMSIVDGNQLGLFANNTIRYMLLFGRLADAGQFLDGVQPLVAYLPREQLAYLNRKSKFIKMLDDNFGKINDPALATVCRRIDADNSALTTNLALADAHRELGHPKKSAQFYLAAARLDPDNTALQRTIAERMVELKALNLSIALYERVVQSGSATVQDYQKLGYLYGVAGNFSNAEKYLRKLLLLAPLQKETYLNLAEVLFAAGKSDEAIEICEKGLKKLPGNISIQLKLDQLKSKVG